MRIWTMVLYPIQSPTHNALLSSDSSPIVVKPYGYGLWVNGGCSK